LISTAKIEYLFIEYLPTIDERRSISIAAVLFDADHMEHGFFNMTFVPLWQTRVRIFDPNADLEILESLLSEIRDRLLSPLDEMVRQLEDSFSNNIQVTKRRPGPSNSSPQTVESFAHALFPQTSVSSGIL
jgi:hypothetical protein